ncbi:16S rRNA (cytosine(1402)-N(4))-methyltransferase RsmH [Candidatus Fermentibacterales bacterium]|nr:16S rRNA (cytosine(1402)-N(4))-methyltransferase RsmH [Candidatus Fermentibacterales bacterium]
MPEEVVRFFMSGGEPESMVDGTAGHGGHLAALLEALPGTRFIALDRDPDSCEHLRRRFEGHPGVTVRNSSFSKLPEVLLEIGISRAGAAFFDLGLSSSQLDDPSRGFSHSTEGPLDMRFDRGSGGVTAADIINRSSERQLADIFHRFGQERHSRAIARAVVRERPFELTTQLAFTISRCVRSHHVKTLSRIFQALRIAVNDELDELAKLLGTLAGVLAPGAPVAFLTFHSIEDRMVKLELRDSGSFIPGKPFFLRPSGAESVGNPRARSAMLRTGYRR